MRPFVLLSASLLLGASASVSKAELEPPIPSEAPANAARASATPSSTPPPTGQVTKESICGLIEAAAKANAIPAEFFTRLIWQESSFRVLAVSPKGAQGIAQFMPGTAAERGLQEPFDPEKAIPASAHLLKDLRDQFSNLGLAAAAYNAGAKRVDDWLDGVGGLPYETQSYVARITGRSAEEWAADRKSSPGSAEESNAKQLGCLEVMEKIAVPPAALPDLPKANWEPWGVQVAGNFSLNRAMASYAVVQRRHASLLGQKPPMVVRTVMRNRGTHPLYQIRVGAPTMERATDLCQRLEAAGGACIVMRN